MSRPMLTPIPGSRSTTRLRSKKTKAGTQRSWVTIGGTSLASPLVASTFALAGGAAGVAYPAQTLYENETRRPDLAARRVFRVQRGMRRKRPLFQSDGTSSCSTTEESFTANCLGQTQVQCRPRLRRPHRCRHPERDHRLRARQRRSEADKRSTAAVGSKTARRRTATRRKEERRRRRRRRRSRSGEKSGRGLGRRSPRRIRRPLAPPRRTSGRAIAVDPRPELDPADPLGGSP